MAKNAVIAGDYPDYWVSYSSGKVYMYDSKNSQRDKIYLDKHTIQNYDVVNENYKKTVSGVVGRAAIGAAFLGPIGLLAGATAKNKGTYVVAVSFKNGRKSLLEIDEKRYKLLVTNCF